MFKKKIDSIILFTICYFYFSKLHAYIDPVTTTAIIQGSIAIFATILIYIRTPSKILKLFKIIYLKIKKKIKKIKG